MFIFTYVGDIGHISISGCVCEKCQHYPPLNSTVFVYIRIAYLIKILYNIWPYQALNFPAQNSDDYHSSDSAYHLETDYNDNLGDYSTPDHYNPNPAYEEALSRRAAEYGLTPQRLHELNEECIHEQEELELEEHQENIRLVCGCLYLPIPPYTPWPIGQSLVCITAYFQFSAIEWYQWYGGMGNE